MIITQQEIKKNLGNPVLKVANIADSGEGKTHFACTFPKNLHVRTGPGEDTTFKYNPELLKNIYGSVDFVPSSLENLKDIYKPQGELDQLVTKTRELIKAGEVESFTLDNITYMARDYWIYIREFRKLEHTSRDGTFDTRKAYGTLAQWMYETTKFKIVSLPCNVIVNVHLKVEDDEALAKKSDKTLSEVASIVGGFRNEFNGLFDLVLYLSKIEKGGTYKYIARVNKGNSKGAKARLPLKDILIENISYQSLMDSINKSINREEQK